MFQIFKKKEPVILYAPVTGTSIALDNVPDPVFAQKMMGDGIAFMPETDTICAPCNGKITMVANTLHAVGITADNGAEILIHIGLDTVNLNGKGFTALVNVGDKVKLGTPLIQIDMAFMKKQEMVLTTPLVVTNTSEFSLVIEKAGSHVIMGESKVITFQ